MSHSNRIVVDHFSLFVVLFSLSFSSCKHQQAINIESVYACLNAVRWIIFTFFLIRSSNHYQGNSLIE